MTDRLIVPPPSARACANCTAWRPWGDVGRCDENGTIIGRSPLGQCRAGPPTIDANAISDPNAAWPVVEGTDWCRVFERRDGEWPRRGAAA